MHRRDFLSTGAVLGAGALMTPLAAGDTEPEPKLRTAVVGCGRQGRVLINAGLKIPGLRFTAVCDILPSAKNSAQLYLEFEDEDNPVAAYADFQEMLDKERDKLDAVLIATPDFVHAEQTVAAMAAGLHVYCEPMMASHAADAVRMIQAAKESGKLLHVGYERRSDPRYLHAAQKLVDPESRPLLLGTITHFETQANRRVHSELTWADRDTLPRDVLDKYGYESMNRYRNWKQYGKYCNGQCTVNLAQQLDVIEWFFGACPVEIRAMGGLDFYKFGDCFDNLESLYAYRFPEGVVRGVSRVWTTTSGGGTLPMEHVFGENGSIQTSLSEGMFRLFAEPGLAKWSEFLRRGDLVKENVADADEDPNLVKVRETGNVVPYKIPIERPVSVFQRHLENFVAAAMGKEPSNCTGESALASHLIAWKTVEAAETGRPITLEPASSP